MKFSQPQQHTQTPHFLAREHAALIRAYGQAQARYSAFQQAQMAEIAALRGQLLRLRAAAVIQSTALAWDCAPREWRAAQLHSEEMMDIEASLRAADLVICQIGCLSHGDYWRVQDHCQRTGKACVLVDQPEALRIVRIHSAATGKAEQAETAQTAENAFAHRT